MNSRNVTYFLGIFLLFVTIDVSVAVTITKLSVPSIYELKEPAEPLILDCDYDVSPDETGFVLKWLHNNVAVYQWIPTKKSPIALGSFKGRVDVNYAVNDDKTKKHRSLVITHPELNDTGSYTCNIQTYQGNDKRTAQVNIIDPADSIKIKWTSNDENNTVKFECNVDGVAPKPEVTLLIHNDDNNSAGPEAEKIKEGEYHVEIELKRAKISDDTKVECLVKIPGSDYVGKDSKTYNDPKTATTKNEIVGQLTISKDPQSRTNHENGSPSLTSCHTILVTALILIFTWVRQ